jgi:tRNA-Thr(GGU) m(6)t(6)A37 methyltransferase TsaA
VTEIFELNAIGYIRSGFREKFAVPRQPGMVKSMTSTIEMLPDFSRPDAFRALREFSHIWIIFIFHQSLGKDWHDTVRPPRLGGNARVGVFASRSPFRPNPVGISAVELLDIEFSGGTCRMHIRGADLIDGTPVLDIKPYLPYSDSINASSGFAKAPESTMLVEFTQDVQHRLSEKEKQSGQPLKKILMEMLSLDPRPAYQASEDTQSEYGIRLYNLNIRFRVDGNRLTVFQIESLDD